MEYSVNEKGEVFLNMYGKNKLPTFDIDITKELIIIKNVYREKTSGEYACNKSGKVITEKGVEILKFLLGSEPGMRIGHDSTTATAHCFKRKKLMKKEGSFKNWPDTRLYVEKTPKAPSWSVAGLYNQQDRLRFEPEFGNNIKHPEDRVQHFAVRPESSERIIRPEELEEYLRNLQHAMPEAVVRAHDNRLGRFGDIEQATNF